jgi:outer membrane biosynthesis protein TonB
VLLSALINLVLMVVIAWTVPHWPRGHRKPQGAPITLTIVRSTPAPDQSALKSTGGSVPPPYIATQDENQSDHAPDQPSFISDKDTLAASEKPASGFDPLPTQDGKQIPAFDFDTRPFRLDKVASSAASAAAATAAQPNATQPKQRQPPAKTSATAQSTPKPPEQATPAPTPAPDDDAAFLKAQDAAPTPAPTAAATPQEFNDPPPPDTQTQDAAQQPMTSATSRTNSPGLPKKPGYQPETIQTRMNGSISNRGRASVAAMGTPMGRYNKMLSDAVGMRWYFYVQERADLISVGSVKIHFAVTQSGKVEDIRILSGKPNTVLADISLNAISEAEIPPIPPDVAATLDGNRLEVDYDFSEY